MTISMSYASHAGEFLGSDVSESSSVFEGLLISKSHSALEGYVVSEPTSFSDGIKYLIVNDDDKYNGLYFSSVSDSRPFFKPRRFEQSDIIAKPLTNPLKSSFLGIHHSEQKVLNRHFNIAYKRLITRNRIESIIHVTPSPFFLLQQDEKIRLNLILSSLCKEQEQKYIDISNRIGQLVEFSEEDDDDIGVSVYSVSQFVNFIIKNRYLPKPNIVFTPSRHIRAKWGKNTPKTLTIDFKGHGIASFAAFSKLTESNVSGSTNIDKVLKMVEPFNIFD